MKKLIVCIFSVLCIALPASAKKTVGKAAPDTFYGCTLGKTSVKKAVKLLNKRFYTFNAPVKDASKGDVNLIVRPDVYSNDKVDFDGQKWDFMAVRFCKNKMARFQFNQIIDDESDAYDTFEDLCEQFSERYSENTGKKREGFLFYDAKSKKGLGMSIVLALLKSDKGSYMVSVAYDDARYSDLSLTTYKSE